jgi:hypothetical protein
VVDDEESLYEAMLGLATGTWTKVQMAALLQRLSQPWRDDD